MNRNLIIAGSVLVVGIVIYFVWKSKKKSPATATAPQGPQPGGAFSPKTLNIEDYTKLEEIFKSGNPYNNDLAKSIEGQSQDENSPLKTAGGQKNLLTKEAFNNLVLAKIRRLIGERSPWIQDEENRRFEEWRGAVRAGYADSLARAFAYAVRVETATDNYYTATAGSGSGSGSGNQPTDYKSILLAAGQNEATANLNWKPTNVPTIIYAFASSKIFFDTDKKIMISLNQAKTQGLSSQFWTLYLP